MRNKAFSVSTTVFFILTIFLNSSLWSISEDQLRKGNPIHENQLTGWITQLLLTDRLQEVDRLTALYPKSFRAIDLAKAFYDSGTNFYQKKQKMLALKCFLRGYSSPKPGRFQLDCANFAAKIYYQLDNRDNALFYVNRVLEKAKPGSQIEQDTSRLKRRIRWEYISSYEGLPDESISDIEFDGNNVWIGMWIGGIARYARDDSLLTLFSAGVRNNPVSSFIRCIAVQGNFVWVGTYDGLCRYDKDKGRWDRMSGKIGSAIIKNIKVCGGNIYAATLGEGLFQYNSKTGQWEKVFQTSANVTDVLFSNDKLYIATLDQGLFVLGYSKIRNTVPSFPIKSLCLFNGKIWAGTHGKGIFIIDQNGFIESNISTNNGLPSVYIETLSAVSNHLIAGTLDCGAAIYSKKDNAFRTITVLDGLPGNDVVRVAFEKNKIWFGTLSGGIGILLTENLDDI